MAYLETKKAILEKIKSYNDIIIVRHVRPDGDCMGSSLGLREILKASFPEKNIYSVGKSTSPYLQFIGEEDKPLSVEVYRKSLVIVVDTASQNRIDDDFYKEAREIIKIDHHLNVEDYGTINYVREDYPAASCAIVDFYETFKDELKLTVDAALALYVGIATDTGRFRYRGVNGDVMRLSAILLDKGLDLEKIYSALYIKEKAILKLQGEIYDKFKVTKNGVAYIYITSKMMKKHNLSYEEAAAQVNSLEGIKGSLIWVAFIDQEDKTIRVRLRSRFIEIVEIASKYRGGGHPNAAGATVLNKKEMKALLETADLMLEEYKNNNEGWL